MATTADDAGVSQEFEGVDISTSQDRCVWKAVLREGCGDSRPSSGDTVHVHYVGTLQDGTKFDSSRDRGELFSFTLGRGNVIKAWDIGVATMKKGELCKLTCKPEYAYGEAGSPPKIPPNATLIFEVELFSWEGEDISPDKDKTILRSIQKEGEKYEKPNEGSLVTAYVIGKYEGQTFLDSEVQFTLGECTERGLPEGVDKAMKMFKKGERSFLCIKPKWAYGKTGSPKYSIPPDATLDLDVELRDFEKAKDSWQMNDEEKLAASEQLKTRGTDFFQQGKYKLAAAKYKRIVDYLQYETTWDGEKKEKRSQLLTAAQLNLALCFLKTGDTAECIKQCNKVLEEDKQNVKAYYRLGQARQSQNDFEAAVMNYEKVLQFEPQNSAAAVGIQQCRLKIKEQNEKDKQLYSQMFQKLHKVENKPDGNQVAPPPLVPFEETKTNDVDMTNSENNPPLNS